MESTSKNKNKSVNTYNLNKQAELKRASAQPVMPLTAPFQPEGRYNIYPTHQLSDGALYKGYRALARWIANHRTVLIDGYVGVHWTYIEGRLRYELEELGYRVNCISMTDYLKPSEEIDHIVRPFLGTKGSVWGKKASLNLADFYDLERLKDVQSAYQDNTITLVLGPGAALLSQSGPIIYFDLPKNELQYRMAAGSIVNLGAQQPEIAQEMYKRFYFVDWPVCNRHKQMLLNEVDVLVDGQQTHEIVWGFGDVLRKGLVELSQRIFRPRPWFTPGSWGGQWLKNNIPGLSPSEPNYGWSFEFIAPENGLIFQSNELLFELSFDCLMYQHAEQVIGSHHKRFGTEFPIRFDFLDTFDGGNLSIQCHPSTNYIQREFGEQFTQDETYYILDAKPGAQVYLGFQSDIQPAEFRQALQESLTESKALDVDRFVQRFPSKKHDFFLIPNGTVHSSGKNNLVLEISATPYIFTFKMYDWLSLDLNGKPRPINIDHAFANLNFNRKGDQVKKELISRPAVLEEGEDWRIVHLPTHPDHFYDVHRLEFSSSLISGIADSCELLMLVQGEVVDVHLNGRVQRFAYAETFVVPASVTSYGLTSPDGKEIKVIRAFMKPVNN